jgi:tetratricopeptide (TPR) repeat protein
VDATARELRRLRDDAAARPGDPVPALALAQRYLALGQQTQDPRYVGYSRAALQPWWADENAPTPVIVLRAAIRQNRHEFDAALADLDLALERDPGDPRAWALRATVLLVQGRPDASLASCARLERLSRSVAGVVCQAAAMARLGRAPAALALLDTTLTRSAGLDPALEAWLRTELAETALLESDAATAERQLRAALRLDTQDAYTINALADLLLDLGRPTEALALVQDDPRHDGKLLRAAIAMRMLSDPAWVDQMRVLDARFAAATQRGDALHLREEARFRLELTAEPARALRLAQENWQHQREPADVRILLETALAAGTYGAASPALAWLDATGFVDARLEPALQRLRGEQG